jgi:L-ascorbate metabolism protein UlaG (beta-lactamase superfamily)
MRTGLIAAAVLLAAAAYSGAAHGAEGVAMNAEDMLKNISWLGHATFRITAGGRIVYFDPYKLRSNVPADVVFVTHGHFDHCSKDDLNAIATARTVVVATQDCASKINATVKVAKPGDKFEIAGMKVEAVAAYNIGKEFHPKSERWVGYVVTIEGVSIYFAGDTDLTPEVKKVKADIALLPVGGTYTMTADEAVQAALAVRPQIAVPMHFGTVVGSDDDARRFSEGLKGKIRTAILPVVK